MAKEVPIYLQKDSYSRFLERTVLRATVIMDALRTREKFIARIKSAGI
jgi:hypothetical protein